MSALTYQTGFGNELESEALPGALPLGQFSPQQVRYGLYAEKFSLTAFTAPGSTVSDPRRCKVRSRRYPSPSG